MSVRDNFSLIMKKQVIARLEENDLDGILALACRQRAVTGILIRLAYDKTTLAGWRAILAIGRISRLFVTDDYDFLRTTIRKLLWSLSDESGGIGWSAPEMLGEIVSADPGKMADIIPLIAEVYNIEESTFRPGVLYALKRIAETRAESVLPYRMLAMQGISESDPLARIHALELLDLLAQIEPLPSEFVEAIRNKCLDKSIGWIYKDGRFADIEVGELSENILKNIINK